MPRHVKILNANESEHFDLPPEFKSGDKKSFFYISAWEKQLIESMRTPSNKVGFILQLGYFKAVKKFFSPAAFRCEDIDYVRRKLGCESEEISFKDYKGRSSLRHQKIILQYLGHWKFDENARNLVIDEAKRLSRSHMKPRYIFLSLIDFLREKKIEVPTYYALAEIVTTIIREFETSLADSITKVLTEKSKTLLEGLLEYEEPKKSSKIGKYRLTLFKKFNHSTRLSRIKENIQDLQELGELYQELKSVIDAIDISPEAVRYYAGSVIKGQAFQTARRDRKRYLYLVCFVIHQYCRLNDILAGILLKTVQSALNASLRDHRDLCYERRRERTQTVNEVTGILRQHISFEHKIESLVSDKNITNERKIEMLENLFEDESPDRGRSEEKVYILDKESNRELKGRDYYDILQSRSRKLQNRVSNIIKELAFDSESSNPRLLEAIDDYRQNNGVIANSAPAGFLDNDQKEILYNESGRLNTGLYKILLFVKTASAVKSGALNLVHSFKYKAFEDYLIPAEIWGKNKNELLEKAGLTAFKDYQIVESNLKKILSKEYEKTNKNISTGTNEFASVADTGLKVSTPKRKEDPEHAVSELFNHNDFISLYEVLWSVNNAAGFLKGFEHHQQTHNRKRPAPKVFFAGITGYGCNIGIGRMGRICRNVSKSAIDNTVNWYFTNENLLAANDRVAAFMDSIPLLKLYMDEDGKMHTSCDGQKYGISVDSLNANYSYKYFGSGKGVSVNSFIDQSHRLFYSTVMSPADREAAYVIDGLLHNEVVQSDIHSTDTHGYSEMIFGVTHLLGISFAPRIKNLKKQHLYSFRKRSELKNLGYRILPQQRINSKIIKQRWDDILRLIATIKLKQCTASQLFKRLSSYSKQHPLYTAVKDFGKIIKSIFLLRYIDDLSLRQDIQEQLSKGESAHRFARAVFHGRNQEFSQSTKEEQLVAEGCKRLIENAIICWNYMYLSQLVSDTKNPDKREHIMQTIKNGTVVTWEHINLHGEYDFSDEMLENSVEFSIPKILQLDVA